MNWTYSGHTGSRIEIGLRANGVESNASFGVGLSLICWRGLCILLVAIEMWVGSVHWDGIGHFIIWWMRLRHARSGWFDGVGGSGEWSGISCFVASHSALPVMFSILLLADGN